ncbi:AAA family ATPase [Micromonospora sp. 050-3]|uniref:AAA family ATPase n=1 Tax=Micromonospora sp. 050-3 TaxID=2789265 RepID=UPI00397CAB95
MPPASGGLDGVAAGHAPDGEPVHEPASTGQVEPGGNAEHGRTILLTPASQIRMRPVAWTWTNRIPSGALTVIPGREGIGKSLTLAWLTAQITRGILPGRHHGTPRPVIYAATEDSWSQTIGPRLFAAGADMDMVYRVDVQHDGGFDSLTLPRDCTALGREISRLGVALLAADPLLSLIHAGIDTHRDRDLRTALEPLVNMADRTGCAVVGLAHFNKSASPDALNLITGSRAFSAVARAVIAIARDDDAGDGSCVMSQAKNNLGPLDLPSLRYVVESVEIPTDEGPAFVGKLTITGESDRSVADILGDGAGDGDTRSERDGAAAWLKDFLIAQGGEAAWADVRKAARAEGIAERTIQRARSRAGVTVERHGFPSTTVWCLNPSHGPSPAAPVAPQSRQSRQLPERGATGATGPEVASLPIPDHGPSLH